MADDLATFHNRLRIIASLDRYEIPSMTDRQWHLFRSHPYHHFIRADDPTKAAIWAAIMKRETR